MVTKQDQLEWLANKYEKWPVSDSYVMMNGYEAGLPGGSHYITKEEWQQERDKIAYANKAAMVGAQRLPQVILEAYKALDELPHTSAILEAWKKGANEFMSELSSKAKVDNSWHERGELPPVGVPVELWLGGSFAHNCEFISKRGNNYVLWNLDSDKPDCADYMNSQFRPLSPLKPLRTEREKAIDEMVKLIGHGYMSAEMAKELAIKMHDAGLRMTGEKK